MTRSESLITNYIEDSLTDEEVVEFEAWLKEDAANMKEFVTALARDEQLRRTVSTSVSQATANASRPTVNKGSHRSRSVLRWMLTASMIVAVSWFLMPNENSASIVTFEGGSGSVSLQSDEGVESGLESGETFTTGTLQVGGDGTRARFSYEDGSRVSVAGGAELEFTRGSGKRLTLNRGTLAANVSPQSKRQPLVLRTPTAEATTLGTSFIVDAEDADLLIRVNKGKLKLRRLSDNQTFLVAQNQQVQTDSATSEPLQAEKIEPLPSTWKASPKTKGKLKWRGDWMNGDILKAAPQKIFLKKLGVHESHYHAGARNDFPGIVTLEENTKIRIRYRINRPINIGLFISTHSPTWNYTGNFQAYIQETLTLPDAEGWRTATVALDTFHPLPGSPKKLTPGSVAATIFATTYADDVGLEVAELEVLADSE